MTSGRWLVSAVVILGVPGLLFAQSPSAAAANAGVPVLQEASALELGNGTMSGAAARSLRHGPLPANRAQVEAKARANAAARAARAGRQPLASLRSLEAGQPEADLSFGRKAPSLAGGRSFAGQFDPDSSPSDSTGAIGPTRYVQLVNSRFAIYNRTSNSPISAGTLNALVGAAGTTSVFDPQILWDATTNRFYFASDVVLSDTDNRVAFGFSKTASPNGVADWCRYTLAYGAEFPDYPKMGDSQSFIAIGVNVFEGGDDGSFLRADAFTIRKPAAGTGCPAGSSFIVNGRRDLRDSFGEQVFAPTPANQIDTTANGYILATSGTLPSSRFWLFKFAPGAAGTATVDAVGKRVLLPAPYDIPPAADQPDVTQTIDTSDTRLSQAVLARNPRRANAFSLWTQHTVLTTDDASSVRWYEINPIPASPSVLRSGSIIATGGFAFNGAIAPDRRVDGATSAFGGSFVMTLSVSSTDGSAIVVGSSVNGAAANFGFLKIGVGPYVDLTCPNDGDTCRWGDYSAASPDPRPVTSGVGAVWITNQFAGSTDTSIDQANWRTWIAAIKP